MKTKTQIVFVASVLAILTGILLAVVRLPQKGKEQEIWLNHWDIALWAVVGIGTLTLIVFLLKKLGTFPSLWFPSWLKWLIAIPLLIGVILWIYREWDSVEKGVWNTKGFADKAITREVTLSAITGVELEPFEKSLPTRYFRVRIRADKDTYWGTCDDGDVFQGISVINTRIKERFSSEANLSDGNIVIQGENGSPTRDGGLVEIKNKPPRVFLDTEKKKSGCKTDAPLKVSIQFIPENP